jgi:superfamily II DNA or RNA helicase
MLARKLSGHFSSAARSRGGSYHASGRVRIVEASADRRRFAAIVSGTSDYMVRIEIPSRARGTVKVSCSCPYIETYGECCKHLWATLQSIDARCGARLPRGAVRLRLTLGHDELDPALTELDDESPELPEPADPSYVRPVMSGHPAPRGAARIRRLIRKRGSGGDIRPPRMGDRDDASRDEIVQPVPRRPAVFERLFGNLARAVPRAVSAEPSDPPHYVLQARRVSDGLMLHVELTRRKRLNTGSLGNHEPYRLQPESFERMALDDRQICMLLAGAGLASTNGLTAGPYGSRYYDDRYGHGAGYRYRPGYASTFGLDRAWPIPEHIRPTLIPMLARTGRVYYREGNAADPVHLTWDGEPPWELILSIESPRSARRATLRLCLERGEETLPCEKYGLLVKGEPAFLIAGGVLRPIATPGACGLMLAFPRRTLALPFSSPAELAAQLAVLPGLARIRWPDDWNIRTRDDVAPAPELALTADDEMSSEHFPVQADVLLRYAGAVTRADASGRCVVDPQSGDQFVRRPDSERAFVQRVLELDAAPADTGGGLAILPHLIPDLVDTLLREGWTVTGNGKPYRRAGRFDIQLTTGIDWFDLQGALDFDGHSLEIAHLLAGLRSGQRMVRLGDGSVGLLPAEWLRRHGVLLELGRATPEGVRFGRTQVGVVDALLQALPDASFDDGLVQARRKLTAFEGIKPVPEPRGFLGRLRDYQKEGLGWALFLREFQWGGCLADDMGLGKTVQVLALLMAARKKGKDHQPALVVVPKSTVGNWLREATRFAPALRVLDYTGSQRLAVQDKLERHDMIITTYGTLRRDVEFLAGQRFGTVVLDEAQAIKNPASQSAKCARLLQASSRLALTGTPVENHLGDLWSIFEFLNPGLLGSAESFRRSFVRPIEQQAAAELVTLKRLIRPFMLRRTKEQVAPELPERAEQLVECDLPAAQRALYNKLRDHIRAGLSRRIAAQGLARSKIHVLEGLLRLRQVACHPALVDGSRRGAESGKLEALLPMLRELIDEGHKALIFSQFTSLLAIVRGRLDAESVTYEYLDGRTRQRQSKIDRFQSDPACPLFLISLKAGGTGLNLTAADYVFILDPWWNPAVEAQAIDRTHRIGQNKKVIAYRLIARDTVESRILELQASKKQLVEALITAEGSLIRSLTREDLARLLS